jgi:hypothetical protein
MSQRRSATETRGVRNDGVAVLYSAVGRAERGRSVMLDSHDAARGTIPAAPRPTGDSRERAR